MHSTPHFGPREVYYVEGNPRKSVAPDTFVVKNCNPRRREIYKLWQEKKTPNFILETTSKTTRREDKGPKMRLYAQLRVGEYFLHDPTGDWLDPPLRGFRLVDGTYVPVEPDDNGALKSEELGITFKLEDGQLAMFETATGQRLLSDQEEAEEAKQQAEEAKHQAEEAKHQAEEAKQQLAREIAARKALEEELARLKK